MPKPEAAAVGEGAALIAPPAIPRIGILAGGGSLPVLIAESITARGGRVHIVAIDGEADAGIARFPHTWVSWGQLGRMVTTLRTEGGSELVIAGGVRRPDLRKLRPDAGFLASLPHIVKLLAGGDDSVLTRVVRFFEGHGLTVRGAHEVAPDLLADAGPLGAYTCPPDALADARLGFAVRAALGPLDAGQAVVVSGGHVVAIEGAEGTDAMLQRVAALRAASGDGARRGVLAKGPKPGQELRVDMPAIGARTVELTAAAGLAGIAVEAGAVLVLGREAAMRAADALGVAVQSLPALPAPPAATGKRAGSQVPAQVRLLGRCRPGARDRVDLTRGLAAATALAPFAPGVAVVVARAYILAFALGEGVPAMLQRVARLRQWGLSRTRRVGVLTWHVDAPLGQPVEAVLAQASAQGLAGVTATGAPAALAAWEDAAPIADRNGLFLAVCYSAPTCR